MDNPRFMQHITDDVAKLDYDVIHNMLQACIDFEYAYEHIFSKELIALILAELTYWHDLAERLREEKMNG